MNFDKYLVNQFINPLPDILNGMPFGLLVREGEPEEPIYYNELEENILNIDNEAEIKYGISKMVISAPSLEDIVIKIPFSGCYDHYDDDYEYYRNNKKIFTCNKEDCYYFSKFTHARNKINHSDYCRVEYEKCKILQDLNLGHFVANTQIYTQLDNNIQIYLQEKVVSMEDDPIWKSRKPSFKSKSTAKQWITDEEITIDESWIGICIDQYGEEDTKRFLDYCNYEDPIIISDVHSGNLGYRKNGLPVILDYSGFED